MNTAGAHGEAGIVHVRSNRNDIHWISAYFDGWSVELSIFSWQWCLPQSTC